MSYRIRLYLTHIATAIVAGYSVWYGLQVEGYSQLAFMALFGASVVVPNAVAAWWLSRGLSQMEETLTVASAEASPTGLRELDRVSVRVQSVLTRQREMVRDVDQLLNSLRRSSGQSAIHPSAVNDQLLTEALGQLSRASAREVGSILTFSNDIAKGAHDSWRGAQEQVRTVDEVVNCAAVISGKVTAVSSDAEGLLEAATCVAEHADRGGQLVQQLIAGMEDIRSNVEFSEKKVASLGHQSEKISSIVETMEGLSARTDMLALNASIEAVRAGQDGRGFSLVADEVRKLAETTATASRDIAALVEAIQNEARETVSVMAEERDQVRSEIQRITETRNVFQDIAKASAETSQRSGQISTATLEQLQATQEVVKGMQQVSTIAQRIDEQSEAIRSKSTDLIDTAQELEDGLSPMYHYGDGATPASLQQPVRVPTRSEPGEQLLEAVASGEFVR